MAFVCLVLGFYRLGLWRLSALVLMLVVCAHLGADDSGKEQEAVLVLPSLINPINVVPLRYPRSALKDRTEGWVRLRFGIDKKGQPFDVEVVDSGNGEVFSDSAIHALSKWTFEPVIVDGEPVRARNLFQPVTFSMRLNGLSRKFSKAYEKAERAQAKRDLASLQQHVDALKDMRKTSLGEFAYLFALDSAYHQVAGDVQAASKMIHKSSDLAEESTSPAFYQSVLKRAVLLDLAQNNLRHALNHVAELEELGSLTSKDPVSKLAEQVRAQLSGEGVIKREVTISSCSSCDPVVSHWSGLLNKRQFSIDAQPGVITQMQLACGSESATLTWEPEFLWNVADADEECHIQVLGEEGANLTVYDL